VGGSIQIKSVEFVNASVTVRGPGVILPMFMFRGWPMPPRESVYRRKSTTYSAGADAIKDTKVKSVLLQIASGYQLMAGHIEDAHDIRKDDTAGS
jgi:hypothetical protein